MSMVRFEARRFWSNDNVSLDFGNARTSVPIEGFVAFNFHTKCFTGNGRDQLSWRPTRHDTTLSAYASEHLMEGGISTLQAYWQFQYDLDIGGLSRLAREFSSRFPAERLERLLNTRVQGTSNLIQSFTVLPKRDNPREYEVSHVRDRHIPHRGRSSRWEFEFTPTHQIVETAGDIATIHTTTDASLPVSFSGALSAEVSAQIGGELSLEPGGVGIGIGGSGGGGTGASVDLEMRHRLTLQLVADIIVPLRVGQPRRRRRSAAPSATCP